MAFTDLTEAERLLWEAVPRGAWVDLGRVGAVVRAEVIGALCWAQSRPGLGRPRYGCAERWLPGGFLDCSVKPISMADSQLPAFHGTRMRLDGILDLTGSVISEIVRLEQAKVTGQLCLRDANLTAARITFPAQEALIMDHCVIGGRLSCRQAVVEGGFRIYDTRVAAMIFMRGARLDNIADLMARAEGKEGREPVTDPQLCRSAYAASARLLPVRLGRGLGPA